MLEIYLIRHAQCESNLKKNIVGGRANHSPLTSLGLRQAKTLASRLAREQVTFDGVYSSIAVRAKDTAEMVCKEINFPLDKIVLCEEFQEQTHGRWEGMLRSVVWTLERVENAERDRYNYALPGGESLKQTGDRWCEGIQKYLLGKQGRYAIFGHGTAIRCTLANLFNFEPSLILRMRISNTGMTEVSYANNEWYLKRFNDKAHMIGLR